MSTKIQPWERRPAAEVLADVAKVSERAADMARGVVLAPETGASALAESEALRAQFKALVPEVAALAEGATKRAAQFLLSEGALDLVYVEEPSPLTSLRLARFIASTR